MASRRPWCGGSTESSLLRAAGIPGRRRDVHHRALRTRIRRSLHLHGARGRDGPGHDRPNAAHEHDHRAIDLRHLPEERGRMSALGRRLRKEEDGYALVVSVILLFVMMMLLVGPAGGQLCAGPVAARHRMDAHAHGRGIRVANDAIAQLSADRAWTSTCPSSGSTACTAEGGEYQVDWVPDDDSVVITSTGYYPSFSTAEISRTVTGHARAGADVPVCVVLRGLPRGEEQPGRHWGRLLPGRCPRRRQHYGVRIRRRRRRRRHHGEQLARGAESGYPADARARTDSCGWAARSMRPTAW